MYLNCHSYYSLRYGTLSVKGLVAHAKKIGLDVLAITDINTMTGVYDFVLECRKEGIKPVVGIEFRNGDELNFIGIARNLIGFKELNMLLSESKINKAPLPRLAPNFNHCYVIYPLDNCPGKLKENEYVGIKPHQVNRLYTKSFRKILSKCVVLQPVTIASKFDYELHLALRSMDNNVLMSRLKMNQHCSITEHFVTLDRLLERYSEYPHIVENTIAILDDCSFNFDFNAPKNKKYYTGSRTSDKELLTQLSLDGLERRYGEGNKEAESRVARELEVIDNLGFSGYFLITWDIIRYSLHKGYYHVGRGSGANSIVAYCIGITDVDPIELDLFFERFLNPNRTSPPDFDIDWSHKTRDSILDYIFKRFGSEHTAFVGTIGTFRYRSPIRELGKVYGLPKDEIDVLTKTSRGLHHRDEFVDKINKMALMLEGRPNLLSMHSCGILVSEEPISQYCAVEFPPKGYPTAQIDMYICEDIGLEKLDILSQRGLSSIDTTLKVIRQNKGEKVDIHRVADFKKDPELNFKLSKGKTIGCFYIESPAMRGLLRRLNCDNYYTLVAASSVIRPGVAKSGMMREYIYRHNGGDFKYLHPDFESFLGETYGIMVYQEDVIKIAHFFGGLDLADGDILRRAMSGKTRSTEEFERVKDRFFNNCIEKGYSDALSKEVYRQIESFAGYSFCKAHSASYSVESYQSLYLKTHYPLEFIVGVINNFGGFYRTEVYVHEAKMSGGNVLLPCVNKGEYLTSISGKDIYLGFIHIDHLESKIANLISEERDRNGVYLSLESFVKRTQITYDQLKQLIYVGALRSFGLSKAQLIIQSRILLSGEKPSNNPVLFDQPSKKFELPIITRSKLEDAFDEIDVLGFSVSVSLFDMLEIDIKNDVLVDELMQYNNQKVKMVGMLISIKDVPTAKGHMNFGTWVDKTGEYFDTTHFPDCLNRFPFQGAGCYELHGKVVIDFHFPSIEITSMRKLPMKTDPRYSELDHRSTFKKTQELRGTKLTRAPYPSHQNVEALFGRVENE